MSAKFPRGGGGAGPFLARSLGVMNPDYYEKLQVYRLKSGIFGQTAKFGQRPCFFHISNIGIKK